MEKKEFDVLSTIWKQNRLLTVNDLENKTPRTLLYGYTSERYTWHVYLEGDEIVTVSYLDPKRLFVHELEENAEYVPNKRLYPEACDFEFCQLLKKEGISLPFTAWNDERTPERFYGKRQ